MKFKTTRKAIKDNYYYIIGIGYCNAQSMLSFHNPIAYSSGVYGWNCDYYQIERENGGIAIICTGYRNIITQNTHVNYDIVNEYEKQAEKIKYNYDIEYTEKQEKIEKILQAFIEKTINS